MRRSIFVSCSALALLVLAGCVAPGTPTTQRFTLSGSATVFDDYEAEQTLEPSGFAGEGDVDYSSFDVGLGVTTFELDGEALGQRRGRAEIRVGFVEFEDSDNTIGGTLDALELSLGGRIFLPVNETVAPFLSIYGVATAPEEVNDFSFGVQVGARLGGGVEFVVHPNVALDLGVDYTLPVVVAESDDFGGSTLETELRGLAARVGIVITF